MASTDDLMKKLENRKNKFFRDGEASRAYQFFGENKEHKDKKEPSSVNDHKSQNTETKEERSIKKTVENLNIKKTPLENKVGSLFFSEKIIGSILSGSLSLREIRIYVCILLSLSEDRTIAKISISEISITTKISRGTVTQILKSLISKGFISKLPNQNRGENTYAVVY